MLCFSLLAWQVITHRAFDVSGVRKTAETVLEHIWEEIKYVENECGVPVIAVVSDGAGECRKAKRLIRQARPDIITVDCFSHQFNLLVAGIIQQQSIVYSL
jgi:hypothetical protein